MLALSLTHTHTHTHWADCCAVSPVWTQRQQHADSSLFTQLRHDDKQTCLLCTSDENIAAKKITWLRQLCLGGSIHWAAHKSRLQLDVIQSLTPFRRVVALYQSSVFVNVSSGSHSSARNAGMILCPWSRRLFENKSRVPLMQTQTSPFATKKTARSSIRVKKLHPH